MTTARIYEYGLLTPIAEGDRVAEQIWLAHRYRNKLVEIERKRREAIRAVQAAHASIIPLTVEVEARVADVEAADLRIRAARQAARSRAETAEDRQTKRTAVAALKEVRARLKAAKLALREDADVLARMLAVNEANHEERIKARAECGVFWGTYLLVESAADQARKALNDPQFRRWDENGAVGIQIQSGANKPLMTLDRLYSGTDTRLRIDRVPEAAWHGTRAERRKLGRTTLRMRVGSIGRDPIWAVWPMIMHRPIPEGSVIKAARVIRRKHGWRSHNSNYSWRLQLTVELPDNYRREACGSGMVAVNPGWRLVADGLRSGYWRDEKGEHGQVLLDKTCVPRLESAEAIRGYRDKAIEVFRPLLQAWLKDHQAQLPEWLTEQAKHVHAWRAASRFVRLEKLWRTQRFDGDEEIYAQLDAWRKRDQHLYAYEDGRRDRALGHRREQYRRFAADLARKYETLVIDATDYSQLARKPSTGSERVEYEGVQGRRVQAAPSLLRQCLRNAFKARGGRVIELPPEDVSRTCHVCGEVVLWDQAAYLHATCKCGATWDQDDNACRNLLARGRERLPEILDAEKARAKEPAVVESRWSRTKRVAREKREAARATPDNSIE